MKRRNYYQKYSLPKTPTERYERLAAANRKAIDLVVSEKVPHYLPEK